MEGRLRWGRDELKLSNPVASLIFIEDPRSQSHEKDLQIGVEEKPFLQTFEGLGQKFLDEIIKLVKEQNDAEDAENARHRQKINVINDWYKEQLGTLRKQHASHGDEFVHKESYAWQHQYQQARLENYPNSSTTLVDPHGFNGDSASFAVNEPTEAIIQIMLNHTGTGHKFMGVPVILDMMPEVPITVVVFTTLAHVTTIEL